jgi:hypothetical protein
MTDEPMAVLPANAETARNCFTLIAALVLVLVALTYLLSCKEPEFVILVFLLFGATGSLLLSYFAFEIHTSDDTLWDLQYWPYSKIIQQYWFNFVGGAFGWFALYATYTSRAIYLPGGEVGLADFLILYIAFAGITGYLPFLLIKTIQDLFALIASIIKR